MKKLQIIIGLLLLFSNVATFNHFWIDKPITWNYKFLMDNKEMVLY